MSAFFCFIMGGFVGLSLWKEEPLYGMAAGLFALASAIV